MTIIRTDSYLSPGSREIISRLEDALEIAREGGLSSIAILCIGPKGFHVSSSGPDAAELNLAADSLKHRILQVLEEGS